MIIWQEPAPDYSREWLIDAMWYLGSNWDNVPFLVFSGMIHDAELPTRSVSDLFVDSRNDEFWQDAVNDILKHPPKYNKDDFMGADEPIYIAAYAILFGCMLRYPTFCEQIETEMQNSISLKILMSAGCEMYRDFDDGVADLDLILDLNMFRCHYREMSPEALYVLGRQCDDREFTCLIAKELTEDPYKLEVLKNFL